MNAPIILLAESVPKTVEITLQRMGYDAKRVQDLTVRGISNSSLLQLALSTRRILVTRDADFLKVSRLSERLVKILYLEAYPDEPEKSAKNVQTYFARSLALFQRCNIVIMRTDGPECMGEYRGQPSINGAY